MFIPYSIVKFILNFTEAMAGIPIFIVFLRYIRAYIYLPHIKPLVLCIHIGLKWKHLETRCYVKISCFFYCLLALFLVIFYKMEIQQSCFLWLVWVNNVLLWIHIPCSNCGFDVVFWNVFLLLPFKCSVDFAGHNWQLLYRYIRVIEWCTEKFYILKLWGFFPILSCL